MPLPAGTRLGGLEILRPLGAGGMGEVYLATDLRLERQVALKLLPAHLTSEPERVKRFEQEARAASALNHPNVCTIHTLGTAEDGRHFIAMEYIEGETLRARLVRGALKHRELLDIAIQIASALTAAHAAGVVHRDLKPENVMLRPDGFVKVLDFGLAKLVAHDADPALPTRTGLQTDPGIAMGTVAYMSPEQARGEHVDARTDVWALGVVLFELIAGRRPFDGRSTSEVLAAILEHDPAPLARFDPDVPQELQRIVTKALQKDPDRRYQVMKDLLLDLQVLRDEIGASERSSGMTSSPARAALEESGRGAPAHVRHSRWRRIVAIVAAVLLIGAAAWWLRHRAPTGAATTSTTEQTRSARMIERPLTKLTSGGGLQGDPTWSPDGRFVAYASDRGGSFDIWVQPVGGGDAVQVTKAPSQETKPDWSPDGATIAYHSDRAGGGVYAVPALGGAERQLSPFGTYPKWSGDSSELLVLVGSYVDIGPGPLTVYAVREGGGQPAPVAAEFLSRGEWYWAAAHPDGRISALGRHDQLGFGFFTVPRDGGRPIVSSIPDNFPLRRDAQGLSSARFQWNAAGTALCFELLSNGIRHLWKAIVKPGTLDIAAMERLTAGPSRDTGAAWSLDGTRLAYTARTDIVRQWLYPFDSVRGRITGEGRPVTEETGAACCADLSLDGRRLLYGLNFTGGAPSELWVLDLEDGSRQLVNRGVARWSWLAGAISRDGATVAYTRARFDEDGGPAEAIPVLHSIGGGERPIGAPNTSSLFFPHTWAPAGDALIGTLLPFRGAGPATAVLWPTTRADAVAPDRVVVGERNDSVWQSRISPDGRWLSFVIERRAMPGRLQVMIAPFDAPSPNRWIRVAADHEWPDKPRWSPDGRTLYFISRRSGMYFNLWGVRFDPAAGKLLGEPFAITNIVTPSLIISPDMANTEIAVAARRLVLTMQTSTGNIWMLEGVDK